MEPGNAQSTVLQHSRANSKVEPGSSQNTVLKNSGHILGPARKVEPGSSQNTVLKHSGASPQSRARKLPEHSFEAFWAQPAGWSQEAPRAQFCSILMPVRKLGPSIGIPRFRLVPFIFGDCLYNLVWCWGSGFKIFLQRFSW